MMDVALLAGYMPYVGPDPELKVTGLSTLTGPDGELRGQWELQRQRGMDPSDAEPEPEPGVVSKVSTFTDSEGRITGQWKTVKREDQDKFELLKAWADRAAEGFPAVPRIHQPPAAESREDLLACYPIGDHHLGMLAWALETAQVDGNYDLKIARDRLRSAVEQLVDQAPACDQAFIPFLGDFFHVDGYKNATPTHGHLLDMDVRFPKMMSMGLDLVENVIEMALAKHESVHVVFEKGNHDFSLAAAMTLFLKRIFRDNPRVTIDESPAWSHYYQFGKVLLGTNHGDKIKPAQQLGVMAADVPEMWGSTTYRMVFLGHVHHETRKEYPGGFVETMPVLPPLDAYAAQGGYRSMSQMHCLIFHRDGWLAQRNYVTPAMFR
jgi:UDP-2,3-diacylglucosamine pyrophosphatase LpxH